MVSISMFVLIMMMFAFQSPEYKAFAKDQPSSLAGMNFSKPQDVYSKNGVLKTTLVAGYKIGKVGNESITGMVYNGSLPGPTLHVYPGDRVELDLINNLNETTNLHFHGLHVSPANNSDNIFLEVAPGKTHSKKSPSRYGLVSFTFAYSFLKLRQVCLACLLLKG
jgi:suppressor of ftsI